MTETLVDSRVATALTAKLDAAQAAARALATTSTSVKDAALATIGRAVLGSADRILQANAADLARGRENGLATGLLDRLTLSPARLEGLASALTQIIAIPDPVGQVLRGSTLPNGLALTQVRVPFGVVGAIYEARPNVTIDIAALALKSGNAVVLRGGSAAERTNAALVAVIQAALIEAGLPAESVQTIDELGREGAAALMQARGRVDVLVPRGSAQLIDTVVRESTVPVIETGAGVVHIYVDESADAASAAAIVHNAKVQRPSVCNAVETVLVHAGAVERVLPGIVAALRADGVTLHAEPRAAALIEGAVPAGDDDFAIEHMSLDLNVKIVDDLDEAIGHIRRYSTKHTESILTADLASAERFLAEVDSAVVMVNASTRFTDGGEFGFGAEVGISTQKLHARGPMGLPELTSTKWIVRGSGQVRG
ncbi:MAG: glutamate-5-semialdehyde dehydrogenase [Microbacteriaceae bacterium]